MTQALLYELLTDQDSVADVARARDTYAERQATMSEALQGHGIPFAGGDGINAWLRVEDERSAIVQLTASGIRVAPGTPFQLGEPAPGEGGHVRVTVGVARDEVPAIAASLAAATLA